VDQALLVNVGHQLIDLLTSGGTKVRAAAWVYSPETQIWRLWIVPEAQLTDKREFYRRLTEVISANREKFANLDVSDVEFVQESNPAIKALRSLAKIEGKGSLQIASSTLNGIYLPDCIILRMSF
jgi:hypothetical protein